MQMQAQRVNSVTSLPAELVGVPFSRVNALWPQVQPLVKAALRVAPDLTVEGIRSDLLSRGMQLWLAVSDGIDGVCVTRVEGEKCRLILVSGKGWHEWAHLLEGIGEWAKTQGCKSFKFEGRKGWIKWLPDWELKKVIMEREL